MYDCRQLVTSAAFWRVSEIFWDCTSKATFPYPTPILHVQLGILGDCCKLPQRGGSPERSLRLDKRRNGRTTAGLPVVLKFLKCHRCPEIVLKSAIVLKFCSFGRNVLIWTLIFKFVVTRWHLLRLKCTKFDFGWGSVPEPAGGAYSAPPGCPIDGFELSNVN